MGRLPKNWKYKLLGIIVVTAGGLFLYTMTTGGFQSMKGYLLQKIKETPQNERRDSGWAEWWLRLAYYRGAICGSDDDAIKMYKEFLGIEEDEKKKTVFQDNKLRGQLVSEDGKIGFGPLHPLAPDAFSDYIELYTPKQSGQFSGQEAMKYYNLLYEWHSRNTSDRKAHPAYRKHWYKIEAIIRSSRVQLPPGFNYSMPLAPPWDDGSGEKKDEKKN